jgi:hypothetical protein
MIEYSQWFFKDGWIFITILGGIGGWYYGLKSYILIAPLVILAIAGKTYL